MTHCGLKGSKGALPTLHLRHVRQSLFSAQFQFFTGYI